jgi:hypothetical protein
MQTQLATGARPTLWLTDPVGAGEPDRLHRAELSGDDLQLVWSSDAYEGTIPALASLDLNRRWRRRSRRRGIDRGRYAPARFRRHHRRAHGAARTARESGGRR